MKAEPPCNTPKTRPRVVHCKKDPCDVYIGRPSKWGNPFQIGRDGDRDTVIRKYRSWLLERPDLMGALGELRGKTLGCWCSPLPCHGDVLLELANRPQCGCDDGPLLDEEPMTSVCMLCGGTPNQSTPNPHED